MSQMKIKRKKVHVATLDQEDGTGPVRDPKEFSVHVPGVDTPLPVIGPTSGSQYRKLREAESEMLAKNAAVLAILRRAWKCTQCGVIWRCRFDPETGQPIKGQQTVRPTPVYAPDDPRQSIPDRMLPSGVDISLLRCGNPKCDAPVVEHNPGARVSGSLLVS